MLRVFETKLYQEKKIWNINPHCYNCPDSKGKPGVFY